MKIYTFLLIITMTNLFAVDTSGQSISIHLDKADLKTAFLEIEKKTDFNFFYNNSLIDITEKVSLKADNQDVKTVLNNLLKDTEIDFRFYKSQIVLFPKDNSSISDKIDDIISDASAKNSLANQTNSANVKAKITSAIQNIVSGTVTDSDGGLPLPGVNVIIKGTSRGVQTDFDGNYQIAADAGDVLVFSFVGMKSIERTVGTANTINLVMESDNLLDEVIVVAYGTAKKGDYTGSATQINSDDFELRPLSNLTTAIEGAAAGVSVTSSSGQPGSGQDIRIRGFGSVSASSAPLYVVDGIAFNGFINSINPNDIESITILKDASSTALYGNKAANGVVLVTTKKGKNKKGQFSFNGSSSIINRSIQEYDRLGPDQYYEIMWEALRNSQAIPGIATDAALATANQNASNNIYTELLSNPYNVANNQIVGTDGKINPNARLIYDDLDWVDAATRLGYRQNYDMSFQAGSDKGDFYASLGYLDEEGYINKSDFTRLTSRLNANYQATDWLKAGLNLGITSSKGNQAQATSGQSNSFVNPIRFSRNIGPIYNIYKHDASGAYVLDEEGKRIYDLDIQRPSGASNGRHVIAEIDFNEDKDEITSIIAKTYVDVRLFKDLTFTTNVSMEQRHFYNTDFENKFVGDGATAGRTGRTYNRRTTVGFNQLFNYSKSLGNHNIKALLGHESLSMKFSQLNGSKTEIIVDGNTELVNFVTIQGLNSYTDTLTDESYFASANYNFDERYFLSGSYRQDGSSKFASETRWGDFWSLGGAWRMENEGFIKGINWINQLKLRGSYGEIGNNSGIPLYAYQGLYDLGFNNQSESGFLQASLENRDLFWETSASYDLAIEFGLFDRLNGTVEYYNRESDNLLFNVPLPLSSGVGSITKNVGTMFNRGIEVSLNYDVIKNDHFTWNLGVNASTIKNEITKLPQEEIITGSKKLMVGHSIFDYWLKDWYGVDPADGAALYVANEEAIANAGSDIRVIDGNTLTTNQGNAEFHYAGTAIPDLTGAITNALSYKNFSLSFLVTFQSGGKSIDYNYQSIMSSGAYGTALSVDILNRWQQPGDITDVPRMDPTQTTNFNATSDRWLVDASYLNLKQINFTYNLPSDLLNAVGLSTAQLYASAENVFSMNKRKGLNIQQEFNGTVANVYTPSRIMTLGLNVKF